MRYDRKTLEDLGEAIRKRIEFYDLIARGKLYSSVKITQDSVIIDVPYAYFVNVGTRPHLSPIKPLIEWAMAKFKVDRRSAYAIAKTVQEKIRMYGTKPNHYIDDALEDVGLEKISTIHVGKSTIIYFQKKRRRKITEKW